MIHAHDTSKPSHGSNPKTRRYPTKCGRHVGLEDLYLQTRAAFPVDCPKCIAAAVAKRLQPPTAARALMQFIAADDLIPNEDGYATLSLHPPIIHQGNYQNVEEMPADNALIKWWPGTIIGPVHPSQPVVNGAGQIGQTLETRGWEIGGHRIFRGDILAIQGVFPARPRP